MAYTIENRPDALVVRAPRIKDAWKRWLWGPLMLAGVLAILQGSSGAYVRLGLFSLVVAWFNAAVAFSHEELILDREKLRQYEEISGFRIRNRSLPLERVSNLRYVDVRPWSFIPRPQGLAFDYNGREKRVLANLEKDEVERIITTVRDRFPALR